MIAEKLSLDLATSVTTGYYADFYQYSSGSSDLNAPFVYQRYLNPSTFNAIAPVNAYSYKDSTNSAWHSRERTTTVIYKRDLRPRKLYSRPVRPTFHLKRFPYKAPKAPEKFVSKVTPASQKSLSFERKVNALRDAKFKLRVAKFLSQKERFFRNQEKSLLLFKQRLLNYERKLSIYEKNQILSKTPRKVKSVRKVRPLVLPENPYELIKLKRVGPPGIPLLPHWEGGATVWFIPKTPSTSDPRAFVSEVMRVISGESASLKAFLDSKVYDKLSNQKIHLAQITAERAQTLDLLTSSVKRLSGLISAKKSLIKIASRYFRAPKKIADDILAFKFGVEPLLKDIEGACEVLASPLPGEEDVVTIRTNSRRNILVEQDGFTIDGWIEQSYVVRYKTSNPFARTLQTLGGINSAEIAWEVTPWSFVVDWIVPVGKFITQASADVGLTFLSGTFSERANLSVTTDLRPHPSVTLGQALQNVHLSGSYAIRLQKRTVLLAPPPKMSLFAKSPFSWSHSIEALALLVQRKAR